MMSRFGIKENTSTLSMQNPSYFTALLFPDKVSNARVPGDPVTATSYHKTTIFQVVTANNAGAAFNVIWNPSFLFSASSGNAICYVSVGTSPTIAGPPQYTFFNGNNYAANPTPGSGGQSYYNFNPVAGIFPAANYSAYRLVAACLTVTCDSSFQNRGGEMHMALVPTSALGVTGTATAANALLNAGVALNSTIGNTSQMQNQSCGRYKKFCLAESATQRIIWLASDRNDFLPTLTDATTHSTTDPTDNLIVATGISTVAAQQFTLKFDTHYELVATPGTQNAGLDTLCSSNEDPLLVTKEILTNHSQCIITEGLEQHDFSNFNPSYMKVPTMKEISMMGGVRKRDFNRGYNV